MNQEDTKEFTMAVGTSVLDSTIMEGDGFYTTMENVPEQASHSTWSGVKNSTGQLCRICANTNDYLIPIYEGEGAEHQLELKIQKHLPIQVTSTDTLPLQLCYQCASTLIAWDTMIVNCLEADKKLRAMQEVGEENEEDDNCQQTDVMDHHSDAADSDDEPLMTSKIKLNEKSKAPLKKKILSKAKSKPQSSKTAKPSTVTKDIDDKERMMDECREDDCSVTKLECGDSPLNPIDVNMIKEEPNTYDCKICSVVFTSKLMFKQHYKDTHMEKVKCNVCNIEMSKKSYRKHLKKFHGFNVDKIVNNDHENDEERRITQDCQQALAEGINPCEVLFKVEVQEGTVEQLQKKMLENPSGVECKYCHQIYSNIVNLKKHIYNVHQMKKVQCVLCEKVVNKKSMDRHMGIVHGTVHNKKERKSIPEEHKIQCHLCDKKCSNLLNLQNHVKNIHEAEQYKCEKCEFTGIKKHLDKHMKKEHNEEIYQCSRCQKILKSKSTLKEHMWIHTDHRRFICDICGMRFKRTSNYHGHLKSHQEKKFQCQLCGNFFLRKRYLAIHQQTIHNFYGEGVPPQEKGYQCEVCGVKLKWKNNLLAHMRIHTGEKPYKCKICGDDFTCHGSLRTHLAKHAICPTTPDVTSMFLQHAYLPPTTSGVSNT